MEGEPSVENMAGPHSINQTTLHLPKPNWPADALAASTLCVEINHIESEVGTRHLHWIHHASLGSPWMKGYVCLHGLLPYSQQIEHLSELHMKTIMERGCFSNVRWGLHPLISRDDCLLAEPQLLKPHTAGQRYMHRGSFEIKPWPPLLE